MKKALLIFLMLCCRLALGQFYPPSAISAMNPSGQLASLNADSSGNIYTNATGSATVAAVINGYVPPVAITGQGPTGQQVYLKADADGNLYVDCTNCNIAGGSLGSVPYQSAPGVTAVAAPNISTSILCFTEQGTGAAGAIPTWGSCAGSAATAFSAITGSTNTSAAMIIGTGGSLTISGSGTINANELNGATIPTSASVVGTNSSGQLVAGSLAFSAITTGTNTVALTIGTNGSLNVSGLGTINATSLGGNAAALYALLASPTFSGVVTAPIYDLTVTTITASATPAIVATNGLQTITLNANASPTISAIAAGQRLTIQICQPNSGQTYTWTWPTAMHGGMGVDQTLGFCSTQSFVSYTGTTMVAENAGAVHVAP